MSSKILLINVNSYAAPYPVYPLGISHLAATLEDAGHIVKIHDVQADGVEPQKSVDSFLPDFVGISLRNIDDIHIESKLFLAPMLYDMALKVREITSAKVIVGGSGFSLFPKELLKLSNADYGICGEGEKPLLSLVEKIEKKESPNEIAGLVFKGENGEIKINEKVAEDASDIKIPKRPKELASFYIEKSTILNVQTQRGCPHHCCYCTYPLIEGRNLRFRTPESVVDDIERIAECGGKYFFVVDSVFNTSKTHLKEVCKAMIKRPSGMEWGCYLRPQGLDEEMMGLMKEAGLKHIEFGSDSYSDKVLKAYGKKLTFADIKKSSDLAKAAKIRYAHFLIMGGPGETEETLEESFQNSLSLNKTVHFPFIGMRIYPGTPLYTQSVSDGLISKEDKGLLKPVFYISPGLTSEKIEEMLISFSERAGNWQFGMAEDEYLKIQNRLRSIGVAGPLWEFLVK